ncbi:MAG: SDR family NAD(P)-dependent oxidoreductase, partial [Candidatus Electrothrix sp. AW3_4]|nr:SDR family NAD(P)-dependent oxidoreductase [Candidatus Electrothrix gigas]
PGFLGISCDLTDEKQVQAALDQAVSCFGGLDMLVLNAGIFSAIAALAEKIPALSTSISSPPKQDTA